MAAGDNRAQRAQIERIVREVLAELTTKQAARPTGKELIVSEKVISAKQLEKQLQGIERLIVPRGAVFTPSARDLLKEKKIAIASAVTQPTNKSTTKQLFLAVDTDQEPRSLINWTATNGVTVERLPKTELTTTINQLHQRLTTSSALGMIITHNTAAALCLANRHRGIRAALATSIAAVADAVKSVAANVLVVDPTGKTSFEWQRLLATWTNTNRPELPAALRERLG
jgi:ethanolamine utilization cobalamin adenosyltransferase